MNAETPPVIAQAPARLAPVEVLPPEAASARLVDRRPIHALSALILVAVDSLWLVFEWEPPAWLVAIPFCFAAVFVPVYLIQRHLKGDSKARALTFASVLAVLAATPISIMTTPLGVGLLAWSGLGRFFDKRPAP